VNPYAAAAVRAAAYRRPSVRPGCVREFDETWDLIDRAGYSLREVTPGHWHVVGGKGLAGWFCTGGFMPGCLTWTDVAARLHLPS
jgi:hypothetical protein